VKKNVKKKLKQDLRNGVKTMEYSITDWVLLEATVLSLLLVALFFALGHYIEWNTRKQIRKDKGE
jgi:hypothetical protein